MLQSMLQKVSNVILPVVAMVVYISLHTLLNSTQFEQFWSVLKSKLKREKLLEKETISNRIKEACNSVLFSDLQGFCHYSTTKFNNCLEKKFLWIINRKPSLWLNLSLWSIVHLFPNVIHCIKGTLAYLGCRYDLLKLMKLTLINCMCQNCWIWNW